MNVERILLLADVIEATPHVPIPYDASEQLELTGFNMGDWHCGTVGCISGWTAKLFGGSPTHGDDALGLDELTASRLFIPATGLEDITPLKAATVLRHLAATGRVDWSVVTEVAP